MRIIGLLSIGFLLVVGQALAQAPGSYQPVGTMSELMVSMIHPPRMPYCCRSTGVDPLLMRSGLPFGGARSA